jgi:hypothetical protein
LLFKKTKYLQTFAFDVIAHVADMYENSSKAFKIFHEKIKKKSAISQQFETAGLISVYKKTSIYSNV